MSCLEGHCQRLLDRFSESGLAVTRTMVSVFDALGVPGIDHIIVAGPRTFSMAQAGLLRVTTGART